MERIGLAYDVAMKARQLKNLGFPQPFAKLAKWTAQRARTEFALSSEELKLRMETLLSDPDRLRDDPCFGELARSMALHRQGESPKVFTRRDAPAPWRQWGEEIEESALAQMRVACDLPVAVRGALMPDAHVGYGLPIGGVLATRDAVIPFAVGVDIACRMRLSVLDLPADALRGQRDRLVRGLEEQTRFGVGQQFDRHRREHEVMDEDWAVTPLTRNLKDKAWGQLGTSGSGNHFVEFGTLTLEAPALGLEAGTYLALLSHSGSRGAGAAVADHYAKLAMRVHPELPDELRWLAWLGLDTAEGRDYWAAMELMGRYAAANHACIHRHVIAAVGGRALAVIENHHNFAWRETHELPTGERCELIVHRKGATPASAGELGVIPGSMASPGYVVRGRGSEEALRSASHGAGRRMSRRKAAETYRWGSVRDHLAHRGVELLSAGIDEVPFAYKDIDKVMAAQTDLVEVLARFDPRLVKMAPDGERPED